MLLNSEVVHHYPQIIQASLDGDWAGPGSSALAATAPVARPRIHDDNECEGEASAMPPTNSPELEVHDSPDRSVAEHVRRYLATDGRDGYLEGGMTNLVLTTRGRKSGRLIRTGLFFAEDDGRYILVASGGPITHTHPSWYLNVVADPLVRVQILGEKFTARARTAEGSERDALWQLMTRLAPVYLRYETQTRRIIPVVVLERVQA